MVDTPARLLDVMSERCDGVVVGMIAHQAHPDGATIRQAEAIARGVRDRIAKGVPIGAPSMGACANSRRLGRIGDGFTNPAM
jgi:hypothetical protein